MPDIFLKENITHGTADHPVNAIHFDTSQTITSGKGFFVENHWHDYVEFLLVRKGCFQLRVNLATVTLQAGDICIFNSGDLHQLKSLEEGTCHDAFLFDPVIFHFHYPDKWNQEVIQPFLNHNLMCANLIRPEDANYQKVLEVMNELFALTFSKEEYWYERCKIKLLEVLLCLQSGGFLLPSERVYSSTEQTQLTRYKKILYYIEENYQEDITLEKLAALIPCNSQYLCRFFKKISGETPIRYLIDYRLEKAERMLKETKKSISDVAMDCGFDNISYFIRKFKESRGLTPGQFREQVKVERGT